MVLENKDIFAAWSLYTGPGDAQPLWPGSRWITGQWNGISDMKNDIDLRVNAAVSAFENVRKKTNNNSLLRVFVIPEFYFHSQYGPYPDIKVEGVSPFKYICQLFEKKLHHIKFDPDESWIVCTGSVLTCNVSDIKSFLSSDKVVERLDELNKEIGKLKTNRNLCLVNNTHIKAKGYMKKLLFDESPEGKVNQLMDGYRRNPLCTVRNRGVVFAVNSSCLHSFKYEKQNESTVDLTMGRLIEENGRKQIETGTMITEWLANYPSISLYGGDKNSPDNPIGARMNLDEVFPEPVQLGVEICLDHRLERLRRTIGMCRENGADANNPPLKLQLIPSGGMQILKQSVAAGGEGIIFNVDGCDPLLDKYSSEGKKIIPGTGTFKGLACGVYVSCAQLMVEKKQNYFSHSQLCFRFGESEIGGYNNADGNKNADGPTYDEKTQKNPSLDAYAAPEVSEFTEPSIDTLYAAGQGAFHIYK